MEIREVSIFLGNKRSLISQIFSTATIEEKLEYFSLPPEMLAKSFLIYFGRSHQGQIRILTKEVQNESADC